MDASPTPGASIYPSLEKVNLSIGYVVLDDVGVHSRVRRVVLIVSTNVTLEVTKSDFTERTALTKFDLDVTVGWYVRSPGRTIIEPA